MEFCGEIVKHKVFGRGQVVNFAINYISILFEESESEKKFFYPAAFGVFLEVENKHFLKQIEEDKNIIAQKDAEIRRINEELEEQAQAEAINLKKIKTSYSKKTVSKTSDLNNIAFKCNYCDGGSCKETVGYKGICSDDTIKYNIKSSKHVWCSQPENMCNKYLQGEISREEICKFYESTKSEFNKSVCYESQMLEIWIASAGITQNGALKDKPMLLRNVKANSLAILTTKLPHAKDKERFIFAVFIIDENYGIENSDEGYVGANPKYKMLLSLEEARELKFWDYYFNPNNPEKIELGSGLHRYFTDVQSAQVIKKIVELKKGTIQEEFAEQLLEYFCKIKKLDTENIPLPSGALKR